MEYFLIPIATLFASILTFFSGFGLGTILLPVFILFFPIMTSITLSAIVHLINNFFKLVVVGKHANLSIVIRFGLPALVSAFVGAMVLSKLSGIESLITYTVYGNKFSTSFLRIVVGSLIIIFAIFEFLPISKNYSFQKKYLSLAGILSGFFGGLSGHQGALRSAVLIKSNLSKESFIGTGVVIACLVDMSRIIGYGYLFGREVVSENVLLLSLCALFAIVGVVIGNKLMKKITLRSVQSIVGFMLVTIGFLLCTGII